MQIDNNPAATERQLWNWKHNIDTGRERLNGAKNKETDFEQEEGSLNNDKYFWMNVFEFYNDGGTKRIKRYWKWRPDSKDWIINPNRPNDYGKNVYDLL